MLNLALLLVLSLTVVTNGCKSDQREISRSIEPLSANYLIPFFIATDAAVGENRVTMLLLDQSGQPIEKRADDINIKYWLKDSQVKFEATKLIYRQWPDARGSYTTNLVFDHEGIWEYVVSLENISGDTRSGNGQMQVKHHSSTPAIGMPAPRVPSKTGSTVEELANITSDPKPFPFFYRVSIADAVAGGKPVLVTFATPAWCTSRSCGPQLEVLEKLHKKYQEDIQIIHVEIFDNPQDMAGNLAHGIESPIVKSWGLTSEPWTFIVDRNGVIAAKFEGFTTEQEIEEALEITLNR